MTKQRLREIEELWKRTHEKEPENCYCLMGDAIEELIFVAQMYLATGRNYELEAQYRSCGCTSDGERQCGLSTCEAKRSDEEWIAEQKEIESREKTSRPPSWLFGQTS